MNASVAQAEPVVELKKVRRLAKGLRWYQIGGRPQAELAVYLRALGDCHGATTLHDLLETAITATLCDDHEKTYKRPASGAERDGYRHLATNLACNALQGIDEGVKRYIQSRAGDTDPLLSWAIEAERDVREAVAGDERLAAVRASCSSSSSSGQVEHANLNMGADVQVLNSAKTKGSSDPGLSAFAA